MHPKSDGNLLDTHSLEEWRILLVDDDEDDYFITHSLLSLAQGHKIALDWASTCSEGKELITSNPYDAVLVDYDLGCESGIEFIKEAKATGCKVPLILFTGRGSYETDMEAMHSGADLYITKAEATPLILERSIRYAIKHKQIEAEYRDSEARFQALVTATPSYAVYCMNPDWTEMRRLDGPNFLAHTVEPDTTWIQKYILPEDHPFVISAINESIRNKSIFELEHRVRLANGTVGWTFSRAVPWFDLDGNIREWFGVAVDITDRKRDEEMLNSSAAQLERSNKELELIAIKASHDLKEPLRTIDTFSEQLISRIGNSLVETDLDALIRMQKAAKEMQDKLNALLALTRVSSQDLPILSPSANQGLSDRE
jgi:CheY-like chemotaxis protein